MIAQIGDNVRIRLIEKKNLSLLASLNVKTGIAQYDYYFRNFIRATILRSRKRKSSLTATIPEKCERRDCVSPVSVTGKFQPGTIVTSNISVLKM